MIAAAVKLTLSRYGREFVEEHPTLRAALESAYGNVEFNEAAPVGLVLPSPLLVGPREVRFDGPQLYAMIELVRPAGEE